MYTALVTIIIGLTTACTSSAPSLTTFGSVDAGAVAVDGGNVACTKFASGYEELLNAPTESIPVKKTVELPTGQ